MVAFISQIEFMTVAFRPEILTSAPLLSNFLSDNEAVQAILQARQDPAMPRLSDRWDVEYLQEVASEVYHLLTSLVLSITSWVFYAFCLSDLSKRVSILSGYHQHQAQRFGVRRIFEENLLATSFNCHRLDTVDVYLQPTLPLQIGIHQMPVSLYQPQGLCKGTCHWLVHLFFKTQNQFTSSEEHLRAIGRQFEEGGSRQVALLQSLPPPLIYEVLPINVHLNYLAINPQNKTLQEIVDEIQTCEPGGVYALYTSTHQLLYHKNRNGEQFLFDPNLGVVKADSYPVFRKIIGRYLAEHDTSHEILIDLYTPRINAR